MGTRARAKTNRGLEMREIKYRALMNPEFMEKSYWIYGEADYRSDFKDNEMSLEKFHRHIRANRALRETMTEFTGLFDKQGVEIYEGDILGRCFDDYDENCIVKYKSGMLILETVKCKAIRPCNIDRGFGWSELKYYHHYRNGFEVIGNIYENSELLK